MVVFITGISSGFGYETAKLLSQEGHTVYGTVRREVEPLPKVHYFKLDVRDSESVKNAVDEIVEKEGRIDVLVTPVIAPAVPEEDVLIRFALMATHTFEQVDEAVEKITLAFKDAGIL